MKNNLYKQIIAAVGAFVVLASCNKTLDLLPTNDVTSATVYADANGYRQAFAKVYASYALTGNAGPAGNGDIQGIDEGTSDFLRLWWKAQELSTDEAVVSWGDPGIQDFHNMNWSASNPMLTGLYYRCYYQITLANDFIRQSADATVASKGITGVDAEAIKKYRAEARFLRAYQYSILMDLFGNVPITTEADPVGFFYPEQKTRAEVFAFVESELKDLDNSLANARSNEYGRVDKTAAKFLLAQIYLNSKVYTGVDRNNEAAVLCNEIINGSAYTFADVPYRYLFSANNDRNGAEREFIFPIIGDGNAIRATGGGMSFIIHASIGGSMDAASRGMDGGWQGTRTRKEFVALFPDATATGDKRGTFYTDGQALDITNISTFTDGYALTKFTNVNSDGTAAQRTDIPDTDFPMFRLTDAYLMYADCAVRGAGGATKALAKTYVDALRTRANTSTVLEGTLTLDFIPFLQILNKLL